MHPDEIEDILAIAGTRKLPRDPVSKYRPRRDWNIWMITTEDDLVSTDNVEHINHIIEKLNGKEQLFDQLRQSGCETKLSCFWVSTGQGGPALDRKLMKRLSDLGLDISWDIYFENENA